MQTVFTSEQMALPIQSHCSACQVLHPKDRKYPFLDRFFSCAHHRKAVMSNKFCSCPRDPFKSSIMHFKMKADLTSSYIFPIPVFLKLQISVQKNAGHQLGTGVRKSIFFLVPAFLQSSWGYHQKPCKAEVMTESRQEFVADWWLLFAECHCASHQRRGKSVADRILGSQVLSWEHIACKYQWDLVQQNPSLWKLKIRFL